jgi:hypothetical protein
MKPRILLAMAIGLCCNAALAGNTTPADTSPIVTKPAPVFSRPLPEVPFQGPRSQPLSEEELQPETKPVQKPIAPKIVTPKVEVPVVEKPAIQAPKKAMSPEHEALKALEALPEIEAVTPTPPAKPAPVPAKEKALPGYVPTLAVPVQGIVHGMRESAFIIEARKAFRRADADKDGILREEELLELKPTP